MLLSFVALGAASIIVINIAFLLYAYDRLCALIEDVEEIRTSIGRISYSESRRLQDTHVRSVGPTADYVVGR